MPEITIGLFPDVGGTWFLNRMPLGMGKFFALTGARINAADALLTRLADFVLPDDGLPALIESIENAEWSDNVESNQKQVSNIVSSHAIDDKELGPTVRSNIHHHQFEIEHACQQTSLGEIVRTLEGLLPENNDTWLSQSIETMQAGSPLSLLIIYEQLKRHRYSDLKTIFCSEYQLATNVIRYPEFAEGVRALLIDKDKQPKWQYPHFSHVPASLLEKMFTPPWPENPLQELLVP